MASSWWSKDTVAVVTGANRGLGLEIVRQLAEQGVTVVLTARDSTKGQAAADGLLAKGLKNVVFHQLDVSNLASVQSFASWLKTEYGEIDILINNAGIAPPKFNEKSGGPVLDYENAKHTLDINYCGVRNVTATLLPVLRPSVGGARIVNVTSRLGLFERLPSESIKNIFRDEDNYTEELADSLVAKYLEDMKAGQAQEAGWVPQGEQIYSESKMFQNVYTKALAKSLKKSQTEGHEIFVAGMSPGVVTTDMLQSSFEKGLILPEGFRVKTVEEGADTAVWLALLPKEKWEGKSGKLFAERAEYPFSWKNHPYNPRYKYPANPL